jgi:urease accessory protein
MHNDLETYVLLVLSDSNLPTGSFVASAGLESYVKHGFSSPISSESTIDFVRDSLASYAKSALPFVSDAHRSVEKFLLENEEGDGKLSDVLPILIELDGLYQAMTLNHVARRASTAQGVALLTLYTKAFLCPTSITSFPAVRTRHHENQMAKLVDEFKLKIRREEVAGHLPICWGILTAALGLRRGTLFLRLY